MDVFFERSSPSSSAEAPSERLGSSRSGTSRLRDFHFIKFRPADIPVWLNASRERLLRAPRPLRLRLRCQIQKRCRSASGCIASLHNPRLTDAVHSLQAGKTVDISRVASEYTDLLPPSALPRLLRSLRLSPPSRPAACRLAAAAAAHRAAVVVIVGSVGGAGSYRHCQLQYRYVRIAVGSIAIAIYRELRQRLIYAIYTGCAVIGDFETFDDSRLSAKLRPYGLFFLAARHSEQAPSALARCVRFASVVCEGLCTPSVVHTHYGQQRPCSAKGQCGQQRPFRRPQAAKSALLGLLCSSMSAEPPPKSRDKWKKVCETESAKAASDSHQFIPRPQGDERPGTFLRSTGSAVRRALDITRNCVTAAQSPPTKPKPLHNRSLCRRKLLFVFLLLDVRPARTYSNG